MGDYLNYRRVFYENMITLSCFGKVGHNLFLQKRLRHPTFANEMGNDHFLQKPLFRREQDFHSSRCFPIATNFSLSIKYTR